MFRLRMFFLLAAALCSSRLVLAAPLVPLEALFANDEMRQPVLSPDGSKIAFLINDQGKVCVAVWDTAQKRGQIVFRPTDSNVLSVYWKGNDRLVFCGDAGGNEWLSWRAIDADGQNLLDIFESVPEDDRFVDWDRVGGLVHSLPRDPDYIVAVDRRRGLFKKNVRMETTVRRQVYYTFPEGTRSYGLDREGQPRQRERFLGGRQIYEAMRADGGWLKVKVVEGGNREWRFFGFSPDYSRLWYIDYTSSDRGVLMEYDIATAATTRKVFSPPAGEITEPVVDSEDRIIGIGWEDAFPRIEWLDPQWKALHERLLATFKGSFVSFVDMTQDQNTLLLFVVSDRHPGSYYLYDRKAGALARLAVCLPGLDEKLLPQRRPISYKARDGLVIHGYLSLPPGREKVANPLILLPHGGPFGPRDSWFFDPEAAFYATRGYTVLQVNYRGSGGYGNAFESAGAKQWGLKMQDDLTDAVRWAIEKGLTRPDTVGIAGASYGGYATLAGLVYTPELYRIGINYVGVSDLSLITDNWRPAGADIDLFYSEWVGRDTRYVHDQSPVNFVDRIRVPTLHAYGENDPRVRIENWQRLEKQLKKYGKTYEYVVAENEGHGFRDQTTRIAFYRQVESFLRRYFPSEALQSAPAAP